MSSSKPNPGSSHVQPRPRGRASKLFWIVPALTFLAGLVLGGVLIGVAGTGSDDVPGLGPDDGEETAEAGESPSPESATEPTQDRTVTVPASCLEVAQLSQEAIDLTREAAEAVGSLDARRLQEIVDELQALEPEINELAARCQDEAAGASGS